jgi:hypothetical protein
MRRKSVPIPKWLRPIAISRGSSVKQCEGLTARSLAICVPINARGLPITRKFFFNLQPGSDKAQSTVHHTSAAREQLFLRQRQRILLIANLDEKRKGIEGVWYGYNASLTLAPARGKSDGTLHAEGNKWDVEDYKAYCDFTSDGKIQNGIFKAVDEFPKLTRDSGTLVVDAEDAGKGDKSNGSEQPSYCSRMRSPKARLFPVKPGSGIEQISKLLRP